jgi:enhancer of polycomb-like protein
MGAEPSRSDLHELPLAEPLIHRALIEQGCPFPPFSNVLTPDTFAASTVPSPVPQPSQILRLAKVVCPYWKERRIERSGHRAIPTLST